MARRLCRKAWLGGVAGLLLPIAGCESDTTRSPVVVVTPQPPPRVVTSAAISDFHSGDWVPVPIPLSQRGTLDITVDWTFQDTWMYVYFGNTECGYKQLSTHSCPFLISSETKTPKPRRLVTDTLEAGTYYLVLYNVPRDPRTGIGSDGTESVVINLGFTLATSGAGGGAPVRLGRPVVLAPPR